MACDSATLSALLIGDGYDRLSERDVQMATASILGVAASLTATTALALSQANGYDRLSEREILMCIANVYGTVAGLTATTALALAQTNQYDKPSDADLDKAFLATICGSSCAAEVALSSATTNGYARLSDIDLRECILTAACSGASVAACDAASVLASAVSGGYGRLSERDLEESILASACVGGGGGGGSTLIFDNSSGSVASDTFFAGYTVDAVGSIFVGPSNSTVTKVSLPLKKFNNPTCNIQAFIYSDSPGLPGAQIGTGSDIFNAASLTTTDTFIDFPNMSASITNGVSYWVVLIADVSSGSDQVGIARINTGIDQISTRHGGVWDAPTGGQNEMKIYGS